MESLVVHDEKLPGPVVINFEDNSASIPEQDNNDRISSEDSTFSIIQKPPRYTNLTMCTHSKYEDTSTLIQNDCETKPLLMEDNQSSSASTENDIESCTESSPKQMELANNERTGEEKLTVHKTHAEIQLNLGNRNNISENPSFATVNNLIRDGEQNINALCNSFRVLNSIREESSELSQDDAEHKYDEETGKHCEQQSPFVSQSDEKLEHFMVSSRLSQTKLSDVGISIESTKEIENCYQELSIPKDADYIQLDEDSCGTQVWPSRKHPLDDVVCKLPRNPSCTSKSQYPLVFDKKHVFGWRRPSDITDLQSKQMWMEHPEIESVSCTPPRRRHSDDIPQGPTRYLNARFDNLREILHSNSWLSIPKHKKKSKEKLDNSVELMSENDTDSGDGAKLVSVWTPQFDENAEVIIDTLREVVRKCTNPDPSLRPSSAVIYRKLNKSTRKLKQVLT